MKKLTRMKLINWHYIVESTIEFNGGCLITGDNGAGKSTILDAMQFVLTCGKTRFNSAAHDRTKRDLLGYVRCKTGNDSNVYERSGDVTSHVALEFYEEKKKKYFIIGAVIDSSSDLSSPKCIFYRMENTKIADDLFLKGSSPRNISDFRVRLKTGESKLLNTQISAQEDFIHRFGSIGYRFFDILPKALAFRPISNVKDFVYSYLLDEKQVNIEFLKENVKTYMEFEKVLKVIKAKLNKLDEIINKHNEILRIYENIRIHDYIILRSQKEMKAKDIEDERLNLKNLESLLEKGKDREIQLEEETGKSKILRDEMHKSLLNNQSYQLINTLENDIKGLNTEHKKLLGIEGRFDNDIQSLISGTKKLYEYNCEIKGIEGFLASYKSIDNEESIGDFIICINAMEESCSMLKNEYFDKKAELDHKKREIEKKVQEVEKEIKSLENKKLVYDENIIKLKDSIANDIKIQIGKAVEPRIICELLQIKDSIWKNAVEGYLNTQRFNLIVDPEYFDISVDTYERVKVKRNIHSVGLINTQKLEQYEECPDDSLANIVTSEYKYAKCYINMILGKVVRCNEVSDLKKYQCSITPTCMVYQNNTARQINPGVYEKPYIGEDAYKRQLELKVLERQTLKDELSSINNSLKTINIVLELVDNLKFYFIRDNSHIKYDVRQKKAQIKEKEEQLSRIDKSTILSLQIELENLNKNISSMEVDLKKIYLENIEFEHNIKNCKTLIDKMEDILNNSEKLLLEFENDNTDILSRAKERYIESLKNRSLDVIYNNFTKNKLGLETQYNNKLFELKQQQRDYNREFHFGGAESVEGMVDFYREYKILKDSKVIEYEEKIKSAREKAEEEFKEHFLSKLQENVVSAQNEFRKLNDALKGIKFGEDEYKFQHMPSKEYEAFYKMIMDSSNLPGENLFTGFYREKHKAAMDELFERITMDDENSKKALEKFTDYRTFMDYDIKIYHENGATSSFSKVCREKSGGETQTPYYVAIAASFVQLYDSGLNNESIGLILFDEAFDKMDENRIESMMKFLNKLQNLQIIIAAPPQKVESISPYVGTTLIVFREDKYSFVEALYQNEKLQ